MDSCLSQGRQYEVKCKLLYLLQECFEAIKWTGFTVFILILRPGLCKKPDYVMTLGTNH